MTLETITTIHTNTHTSHGKCSAQTHTHLMVNVQQPGFSVVYILIQPVTFIVYISSLNRK